MHRAVQRLFRCFVQVRLVSGTNIYLLNPCCIYVTVREQQIDNLKEPPLRAEELLKTRT